MPLPIQAALWGLLGGSALLLGAAVAWLVRVPPRFVAAVMAFGGGVLVSALALELMDEAYARGGLAPAAFGILGGAAAYTAADLAATRGGDAHRMRSGDQRQRAEEGSGLAIAVGASLDGVPESAAIGATLLEGGVGLVTVAAVFLSNVPEPPGRAVERGRPAAGRARRGP